MRMPSTDSAERGAYVSLGGSNSAGHGVPRHNSFADLTAANLIKHQLVHRHARSAIPAMGPVLPATCLHKYVPADVRFATVEYLANMGFSGGDDLSEVRAVEMLLERLQGLGARTVVINVVPSVGLRRYCTSCIRKGVVQGVLAKLTTLAEQFAAPVITVQAQGNATHLFSETGHLSVAGHAHVHAQLMHLFGSAWQNVSLPIHPRSLGGSPISVKCLVGDEIAPLITLARNFNRVNFGPELDKVGYETRSPSSELRLCLNLKELTPKDQWSHGVRSGWNPHNRSINYRVAIGMQTSHLRNLPLFGVARFRCAGCVCAACFSSAGGMNRSHGCEYDTLTRHPVTVANFFQMYAFIDICIHIWHLLPFTHVCHPTYHVADLCIQVCNQQTKRWQVGALAAKYALPTITSSRMAVIVLACAPSSLG